jgi:hypothetical protein
MRLTRLICATLGTSLMFLAASSGANAYDHWRDRERNHWRHDHSRHNHWRHDHSRHDHWRHSRPAVVRERPVIVERERPIFVQPQQMYQPQPMYMAPMMPQGPGGVNLNFTIPLH